MRGRGVTFNQVEMKAVGEVYRVGEPCEWVQMVSVADCADVSM